MSIIESAMVILASIASAIFVVFGVNLQTEQPRYQVLERIGPVIEIRNYAPRIAAETTIDTTKSDKARSEAFRLIAGYIFGANKTSGRIAMTSPVEINSPGTEISMTTPVEVNKSAGVLVMRFFMPSKYLIEKLPEPLDSRVKLIEVPELTVAVLQFSGSIRDDVIATRTSELFQALASANWKIGGPATAYFYNPPWTIPFLRTNEVVIPVTK